jgi:iron complex outermembrane receptor protein/hemoglobin/transferrin/lactoferrin receptor protein
VLEESGGAVAGADLVLRSASGSIVQQGFTAPDGTFRVTGLPASRYVLEVAAVGFAEQRVTLDLSVRGSTPFDVVLSVAPVAEDVTVTAERGLAADAADTSALVTVRDADALLERPLRTIGHALEGAAGVMVQESAHGQASPFLRGLTGYHVLNLIDGVRFNNATFRSGPNQYLAFADPSQAERVEAVLGPASSQYGSDALGGAIQLLTPTPPFARRRPLEVGATANVFAASGDRSAGGDGSVSFGGRRISARLGGSWRELNEVRAGGGRDSHHVLRRLFGLSDDQIEGVTGTRQRGTGFTQSGVHAKVAARVGDGQNLTVWLQRSNLENVRGYKDLWGGLGRLRSDFDPQRLQFFYARYETLAPGPFDWLSATVSSNVQHDGSTRQNLRATDPIVRDDVRVRALGYAAQAGAHLGSRQALVFGGELYDETIDAARTQTDPQSGVSQEQRALYPNGSTYRTAGIFIQDAIDLLGGGGGGALRAHLGGRFTRVDVKTFAAGNLSRSGRSLGVADSSESYQDWTFHTGLAWRALSGVTLNGVVSRGFRAPNLNDLGAVGLNDLGYEVPASATIDAGALVGASDGEGVGSTGRAVENLRAERLLNMEGGASFRWRRLSAHANVFRAHLRDPIVRRTLLFPAAAAPVALAGVPVGPITPTGAQRAAGVVSVATALDPRAVKAFVNEGRARYYGVDARASLRIGSRWAAEGSYSYLLGHDLDPTRPVRRLPPQQGSIALRYQQGGRLSFLEARALVSGAQDRLSGGDLTDERIGAGRRRSDITDFFRGALISPFIGPGADGRLGTDDDVFTVTRETVGEIRDRVLPLGTVINGVRVLDDGTRVPLYLETQGFATVGISAGFRLSGQLQVNVALSNVFDRNYRTHGSGVDAPGVNVYVMLRLTR